MVRHDPDFELRRQRALRELAASPIAEARYDPLLLRLLRRLGVQLRPPHYQVPSANVAIFGAGFALFWGLVLWVVLTGMLGVRAGFVALLAMVGGAVYGWWMAEGCRREAAAAGLSDWSALGDAAAPAGPDDAGTRGLS